ncbi:MAG: hypothetical protein ACK4N5_20965, partial [Myxococcales bacterium]
GPAGSNPTSGSGWTWTASQFKRQEGNNDEHQASHTPTAVGDYAYAYRFKLGSSTLYCDIDGNDGSSGGFSASALGVLQVRAPSVDFARLEAGATATLAEGAPLPIAGVVYAAGITEGSGAGANVTVDFGYGPADSDPAAGTG